MSATYNWAYKPGVPNKYGINIPPGADDVRPTGVVYVALFGNDSTGNGSRQLPYRTLAKAKVIIGVGIYILGSGVYRENLDTFSKLVGDGEVIMDGAFVSNQYATGSNYTGSVYNITFRNWDNLNGNTAAMPYTDCVFDNIINTLYTNATFGNSTSGCIFKNIINLSWTGHAVNSLINCTFYNCLNVTILGDLSNSQYAKNRLIFHTCNIWFNTYTDMSYSLIYNCNVRFNVSQGSTPMVYYPFTPVGYTKVDTLINLRSAQASMFPSVPNNFVGCQVADPLFNNTSVGDFTLSFSSPAKNIAYLGTYVGARSIGIAIKARSTETSGDFEFSSNNNLNIEDDSITLVNPSIDGQIDTKVIVNILGRELANFPSYGFNADRNGQYIDSIADLDTVIKSASDTLSIPASYLVENGAITYNGNTYQPGQRFTTVTGFTSFTTAVGGVLREIAETPQRHTIMARFSDGEATISPGDALVIGYYYYVQSGSVTYNSVTYTAGAVFKATDNNVFSGSGNVILAFSIQNYQHYEPGIKPTSNNVGNMRTGAIIRGNGDPSYVRGGIGVQEFPINAKFIQIRYFIRVNNLKP